MPKPDMDKLEKQIDSKGNMQKVLKKDQPGGQPEEQRMPVPGYERVCELCPYKDLHIQSKNFMLQMQLNENLKKQLQAATEQLEMSKKSKE